jgi:hypothetical protein
MPHMNSAQEKFLLTGFGYTSILLFSTVAFGPVVQAKALAPICNFDKSIAETTFNCIPPTTPAASSCY